MNPKDIYILIGCEESQSICKAFRALGFSAFSCDLKPCSGGHPEWHIQCDVLESSRSRHWHLRIMHPTCTRLCNSGVLRLYVDGKKQNGIDPAKWAEMEAGAAFFKACYESGDLVAVENPVMHGYARQIIGVNATQSIQPYQFGDDASKRTCLWLKGLPELIPTGYCPPRIVDGKPRWANQTDSGQNRLPPSANRAELRSKTYHGIAAAMAEQWGRYILQQN